MQEDRRTVQYFERARFEEHPENPPPFDVLLGQFGRRVMDGRGAPPSLPYPIPECVERDYCYYKVADIRIRLGLPAAGAARVPGTAQVFERGAMLWRADTRTIYVFTRDAPSSDPGLSSFPRIGPWSSFADEWDEGQPIGGGPAPVAGRYLPARGFGKIWRDHPEVRQRLGYALDENELAVRLVAQPFAGGLTLLGLTQLNVGERLLPLHLESQNLLRHKV